MLQLLLAIPIIGCILILPIKENSINNKLIIKKIAIITSLINLVVSFFLWIQFDANSVQYQFIYEINQINSWHFNLGIDGLSLYFVLLTTFITPIALLSNHKNTIQNIKSFIICFLLLETLQIFAFVSLDLLFFYVFFESAKWIGISLLCFKLPNSGDTLKLRKPSYNWKIISGWTNYSGMVTSPKMTENEMRNRGSKSDLIENIEFVKEQRVDGSYLFKHNKLRCTLMGCESNYQISNPSNQINIQKSYLNRS